MDGNPQFYPSFHACLLIIILLLLLHNLGKQSQLTLELLLNSNWTHQISFSYGISTCIPSSPPPAPKGLDSSIGRASHWRCEVVGSIPTQVPGLFSSEKDLGTCIQVLLLLFNLNSQVLYSPLPTFHSACLIVTDVDSWYLRNQTGSINLALIYIELLSTHVLRGTKFELLHWQ